METGVPESFNVLTKEIRSLGIDLELDSRANRLGEKIERFSRFIKNTRSWRFFYNSIRAGLASPQHD